MNIKSKKHISSKEHLKKKKSQDVDIAEALKTYNEREHMAGETLDSANQVYRIKVVTTFLKGGVPLNKLDCFRPLLEVNGTRLAGRRTISDFIPFIHERQVSMVADEIAGTFISVVIDGTTRMGEALAIVVRYIDDDWQIQQRIVRLQLLAKSVCAEELAREIISTLEVNYKIAANSVVGAMHDRASVNNAAMRIVTIIFPQLLDVGCFSHTVDLLGDKFNISTLDDFISAWIQSFSHSHKSRLLWKERTGKSVKTLSKTRWWSRWEVIEEVMLRFGDIEPFLLEHTDVGPRTCCQMLSVLNDPLKKAMLMVEMAGCSG